MKKNLIIANTYFQLLTAINLTINNFKSDECSIVLTDKSFGVQEKVEKIKKLNLFKEVIYIESKRICDKSNKVNKYITYLFNRKLILKDLIKDDYDNIIFFNYDILMYAIVDEIYERNNNVCLQEYDEGYITYLYDREINKINLLLRKIFRKVDIKSKIDSKYLYHPELICYKTNKKIKKINPLDGDANLVKYFNEVFDYNEKLFIKEKYIFFEESFFCDNKEIDDLDLILDIANVVGKDNLIVKLHPRNKINRFEKYGIHTMKNIGIPWEIIQMNDDFSNKVLLTISSGSVLASRLYFNDDIKTYLLYNCTSQMSDMVTDKYKEYLNKLKSNIGIDSFIIPNCKSEFLDMIRKENETN